MWNPAKLLGCLIVIQALPLYLCKADEIVLHDGEFNDPDWSQEQFGAHGGVSASQMPSGGNPGAYRYVKIFAGGFGQGFSMEQYSLNDPAAEGAILSLDYSQDFNAFSNTGLNAPLYGIALEQDGNFYDGPAFTGSNFFWLHSEVSQLRASDFGLPHNGESNMQGPHPDFSTAGQPIRFGFYVYETNYSTPFESESGVDNWDVTLHVVPEPAAPTSLGALLLLSALRRRRAVRLRTDRDERHVIWIEPGTAARREVRAI